jgi:hypothetical protein
VDIDGSPFFVFSAYSDLNQFQYGGNPVDVATSVVVTVNYTDGLGETTILLTIPSGANSVTDSTNAFDISNFIEADSVSIFSISPSSFGSQVYKDGGVLQTGTCP